MKKKAIVLFSGGQDSTTCLMWAIHHYGKENVSAMGFDYGQKHKIELEQASKIAELLEVPYIILPLTGLLGGSSLTDQTQNVNDPHKINPELPSSFTAGRNALFLTVAASFGYNVGVDTFVTGVCQTDYSGYPDCRMIFIVAMQMALSLALGTDIKIEAPLMYINKAETWELAADLQVIARQYMESPNDINTVEIIRTMTMTDYNGDTTMNDWGMGSENNPAGALRAKGYREAKGLGYI